jgi:hypothetical protein
LTERICAEQVAYVPPTENDSPWLDSAELAVRLLTEMDEFEREELRRRVLAHWGKKVNT